MTISAQEKLIEKVTLLLLSSPGSIDTVASEALDMATRAHKGWWDRPGSPHFNKRMARIRVKLERTK